MVDKYQIAEQVGARIKGIHLGPNIALKILEEGIRQEDDWWYVPVQPTIEPPKTSEYYEALANVEGQMLDEDDINILFIPMAPE